MPAQVPVPGVARVVVLGSAQGVPIANVFHVRKEPLPDSAFTQAQLDIVAATFESQFRQKFAYLLNTNYLGVSVTAVDLTTEAGLDSSVGNACAGSDNGNTVPQSAALCVTWRIQRHYRGGHPRTYLGPLGSSAIGNPTSIGAPTVTTATNAANNFLTAINSMASAGQTYVMVALHRVRAGVKINPVEISRITSAKVDNRIDTQRRRLGPDR